MSELSVQFLSPVDPVFGFDEHLLAEILAGSRIYTEVSIVFIDRMVMKIYNHRYRDKNIATDILSFCDEKGSGELVICPDLVFWGAAVHRVPPKVRLWHLLVHGCTHLRNLDHETEKEAKTFQRYEKQMWLDLCSKDLSLVPWSWDRNYAYHYGMKH